MNQRASVAVAARIRSAPLFLLLSQNGAPYAGTRQNRVTGLRAVEDITRSAFIKVGDGWIIPARAGEPRDREHEPPDTTACIFWLKNGRPKL